MSESSLSDTHARDFTALICTVDTRCALFGWRCHQRAIGWAGLIDEALRGGCRSGPFVRRLLTHRSASCCLTHLSRDCTSSAHAHATVLSVRIVTALQRRRQPLQTRWCGSRRGDAARDAKGRDECDRGVDSSGWLCDRGRCACCAAADPLLLRLPAAATCETLPPAAFRSPNDNRRLTAHLQQAVASEW